MKRMNKPEIHHEKGGGKRIVIIDWGYKSYEYEKSILQAAGYALDIFYGERHDLNGRREFTKNAIGMFCRWSRIDEEFLEAVPGLRAIVRYGVGYDNIDISAASARNIKVCNVQGYASHAVSDHAIALIYSCLRALPQGEETFFTHFAKPPRERIFELHDKTLGIIGLGRIGGTLCRKAQTLFRRIIACDPYIPDRRFTELGTEKADLMTVLSESHVISIHCTLTEETRNMIDADAFKQMKQVPVFINTARGPVVKEDDLLEALNRNRIHGAGLDVFEDEPPLPKRAALINHPFVITTGHYAWYSDSAMAELQRRAGDNMVMLLQGKIPDDCLNP